ncbi:hypothetical protein [Amycolatopsis sp. NPDC059657]|uniref:hypothetical protein n=1 Tax=Amycolatopsis sp. NPDC059657 TaxID=3346899 RepID=UPI00366A6039
MDEFVPHPDLGLREHLIVAAPPEAVYEAVGLLRPDDLDSPLLHLLVWARDLPGKLRDGRPFATFDEILVGRQWTLLGEHPGEEIALGAAGRFWTPYVEWHEVTPDEFATYSRPRSGTIALSFAVRPHGDASSLVTFETRVAVTDAPSRRQASWYWHLVKPAAHIAARAMLRAIRDRSLKRSHAASR